MNGALHEIGRYLLRRGSGFTFALLLVTRAATYGQSVSPLEGSPDPVVLATLPLQSAEDLAAYVVAFEGKEVPLDSAEYVSFIAAAALAEQLGDQATHGILLKRMVLDAYRERGPFQHALDSLGQLLAKSVKSMEPARQPNVYNLLGTVYAYIGRVGEVLTYYRLAAETGLADDTVSYHYALGNLASTYLRIGDTLAATRMLHRSVAIAPGLFEPGDNSLAYSNTYDYAWLAGIKRGLGQLDSAQYFLGLARGNRALLEGTDRYLQTMGTVYQELAMLSIATGDLAGAQAAVDTLSAHDNWAAPLATALLRAAEGRYGEAIAILQANAPDSADVDDLRQFHEELFRIAKASGRTELALTTATTLVAEYRDELSTTVLDLAASTDAQRLSFEAERRAIEERHLHEMSALRDRQRTYTSLALGLACLLAAAYSWRRHQRSRKRSADLSVMVDERDRDLATANAKLARRIEAMERFNHLLSHDLREPMRSISGFTTLLRRRVREHPQFVEDLDFLSGAVKQMSHLLTRVEALRRIEETGVAKDAGIVSHTCREVVNELRKTFSQANIELTLDEAVLGAEVPTELTTIVLREVLANALTFHREAAAEAQVSVSIDSARGRCVIDVRDHGIGIDGDYHELVFTAFKRLNRREDYPGAGIGLTLARTAARRAGGDLVLVASKPGRGSTFRLSVPLCQPASRRGAPRVAEGDMAQ